MSKAKPNPRTRGQRIWQAAFGLSLIALAAWAAWYLTSGGFNNFVRTRVIAELEAMTGGRVELRSFKWNLSQLEFEATDLTIHGLEKPGEEPPYAHADRLFARVKIISLLQREIAIRHVTLERPVVHIIVYPDGTTNQPTPKSRQQDGRDPVQVLLDLAIGRAEVRDGLLIWNQQRLPFDFYANDLAAGMTYSAPDKRYDGNIRIGKLDTKFQNFRPFASQAEVEFSLFPSRAQIKSLKLTSGRSHLEATGSLADFKQPKFDLAYNGTIDLADAGNIARIRELRSGTLDVSGQGTYSLAAFASGGRLAVRNLNCSTPEMDLRDSFAGAEFSFNQERLSISHIVGRVLGGVVQGEADIRNWLAAPTAGQGESRASRRLEGSANLRIQSLSIQQAASAFSTRKRPLDKLNLAGTTSGTVIAQWRDSLRDLHASFDLDVAAAQSSLPEQVPVNGKVRGALHWRSRTLELAELNVRTPATELHASGSLGTASGDLKLAFHSSNVGEFKPLLEAIRGPEPMPVEVSGSLKFDGTASGKFTQPTLTGHLELRDFTTTIPKDLRQADTKAAAKAATQTLHWDLLTGDIHYSPERTSINRGLLRRGSAQINIDATAALTKGRFEADSPFTSRLNIRNADIAELQAIAGYRYPLTGNANANLQVLGTRNDPRGNGNISVTDAVAYGQPVQSLSADVALGNNEAQLRNIRASADAGQLEGSALYNLNTEAFRFDLRGSDFRLAQFQQIQRSRLRIEGLLNFNAQGSGTLKAPVIDAKLRATRLLLNGERIGDLNADAITKGADLKLTARSSYQAALLSLDGDVHLRGDFPANIDLKFGDIYLDPLIKPYLPGRMTGRTLVAGTLHLRGPLRQPRQLNAVLNVDRFDANLENVAIHNDGPLRIVMADQLVSIERFRLIGEQTHFIEASGTAQLAGARRLNLKLGGNVNLKLLQTFSPDILSYGTSDFSVEVGGTLGKPALQGRMQIADAGISYIDLPNGLSGINGTLVFTQDRLQVERLTAKTGGGELVLGGFITYEKALTFNLTARGHDIRLRYPPGISATADANLTLAGTLKSSLLSGEITVTKFGVNPRFDFALYLARSKQPPQVPKADSPLNGLKFDVHVVSTPELQVQTSLAKISGDVDLRLRGTAARPTVLGRVNIVEGDVFFNGTRYHLERGDIIFTNPVKIEPVMDLEATARVRNYDINIGFHGTVDKLLPTYRSDPPLPEGDIIALLALGRTREETAITAMNSQSVPNLTESASNALLGQALNATVSSRVQKLFGVSRIKIDPQVGGPENNPNARLTIEQQVSNQITLTYITNLSQSAQQIIQLEYNVNKTVSILAVRDQNGVVGFDVRVRQRKK